MELSLKRMTKAELIALLAKQEEELSSLSIRAGAQESKLKSQAAEIARLMDAAMAAQFPPQVFEPEPQTEVGYLRKELAYAQGQLHQSHLAVKQLCGRALMPEREALQTAEAMVEEKFLSIADRFNDLLLRWESLAADRINQQDTAAAGLKQAVRSAATALREEALQPRDPAYRYKPGSGIPPASA